MFFDTPIIHAVDTNAIGRYGDFASEGGEGEKKMAKLTKYSREAIARRAVAHAFDPRQAALADAEDVLAREAYDSIFPKDEQALVAAIPSNWFRLDACLQFNVGGQRITLNVKGDGLPVPYRMKGSEWGSYGCHQIGTIEHGELCDRIQKHAQTVEDVKRERRDALRATENMLNAVTTTGKLKEVWPQGEQFYADYEDRPAPALPAVRVDEINSILGLSA